MAYSIVLPDGAVVENIPDEVTPSDAKARIIAKFPQYGPKPEDQSVFRQVADVPLGIAKGIAQGTRMGVDIFGAGSESSKNIKGVEDYIAGFMSAQSKQDQQEIARIQKEAEDKGIWEQVKAGAKSFAVAPIDTLSSAVGTAVPVIAAGLGATAFGAPAAAVTGIGALVSAGLGAGTIKGSIYEATKQALQEAGASPQEAEQKAIQAQEYGGKNLDQILLGTVIGGVAGVGPLEKGAARLIANKISNKVATETGEAAAKGAVRKRIEAGVLESVPEALQAGQERVAQNIALQREGMDVPTFRGAVGAATLEGLAGAGLGAAIGGSGYKQDLVEGQREGETLRQAAERTQQELLDLQAMRSEQAAADQQAAQAAAQTGISSLLGGIEPTRQQRPSVQSPAAFNNLLAQAAEVAPQDQGIQVLLKAAASNSRSATESPANFNSLLAQTALTESPIEKGIASMLAAPETRAMPSRTSSPAAFDTLLAPEITPLPPAAPPAMDPGLMDILRATGGQGPSRVQSPSIANNLLAAEPAPEAPPAPPVMDPGLAKILQAIGGQGDSRTQSPNIANNLLAATPEPEAPPAPPVADPGLAEILKAIGSPQVTKTKSPSVANNLLAAEPAPAAPPVAVPGMSNILKATGQQAQRRVNSPLNANNLLTPEPIDASTEAEPGATQADVGQTTGAGVPVAGQPAVPTTAGVKQPKPKPGGLAVPQPNVERPVGGAGALPTPIATPEQSSLTAASKTPAQQEALGTAEVTFPHSQIVGTVDTQLQQLTNFVNTQGESITAPNTKATPPLIAKARSLHKSLLNEGMSLVDGVHRNFLGEADATPQKVSELQRKVADRVEEAEAFSKQAPKKSLASEGEAVPSPEEQDASLNIQIEAKTKEFGNILTKIMSNMGMRDVALNLVSDLKGANAEYANQLIRLAIGAQSPVRDLRHESIHAMKELGFFSDKQWATLEKMANDKWIKQYLGDVNIDQQPLESGEQSRLDAYQDMFKAQGLSDQEAQQALVEEAIADAFGTFDVQGAPAGLLSAILKRMKSLFASIKTAFGGAETAEQIFQKAEKGKLQGVERNAPKEAEQPEQPKQPEEPKASLRRAAVPDETQISTQNPQGVTRKYDPIEQMLSIDQKAVEEAMEANPEMYNAITNAILRYGFIPTDTKPEDAIAVFKKNIVNNLLFLHDAVPKDIANRSKLWYDGAHKIAKEMGKQYGMTLEQVSGIFAAMSPQKDWFQNVSMGERAIDILKNQGDASWDDNMLKYAESYIREPKDRKEREKRQIFFDKYIRSASKSKTLLKDMDAKTAAAFIRAFDEAYHSRQYRIVTPEGGFGDLVRNNDGKPSTMIWSTYGPIEKAVSIFRDRSRKNISEQLGAEHKIRSFYNNIAAPNADIDHVTIDTHAVAAALFEALAGTDTAVAENFGGTGKSSVLGVGGTYGIIADAYREAAKARGVQAREMQSITWEAIRGLFTEELKSGIKPKVRAEWDKYRAGEQSFNEARDAIVEIASKGRQEGKADWKNPDWIDSGPGQTVAEGGASYDKDFEPEGGVRLREESELREKVTFNLSAVTSTIPGLKDLYQKAMSGDQGAYAALQKAAESSLKYLLSGTSATVKVEYAKGVFLSDKEPSLSVSAAFKEADRMAVLAALERFASNYNQEQIHVRQPTAYKVGHQFDDRSYATPVYTIDLAKDLSNAEIDNVIDKSGLIAFTIAPLKTKTGTINQLIAYWCKQNDQSREEQSNDFDQFKSKVLAAQQLAGVGGARPKQTVERLYAYGRGDTATHGYERIKGDVYPKQGSDTETPRIIADYLLGEEGKTFPPKKLNKFQVVSQRLLSDVFDALPINDLKTPIVRKAYNALNVELVRQFEVLPVKVEAVDSKTEPYKDSAAMRDDVSQNNRLKVYKTQADTFGPEGVPMGDHPLLEESGLVDYKGTPLLYNDLLRAVHDYYAHGVTPAEFGPKGEASAWLNHMASTMSPLARWAITAETRAQNAWTNFRPGAEEMLLKDRGFSLQKAALPPVQFALTGDEKVDAPMQEFIAKLTPKQQLGSLSSKNPLAKKIGPANKAKFSIRAPDTKEFKQWFGKSTIVDANGNPRVMYHGTARDITSFRAKQANAIFVTDEPTLAENYAYASADWMAKNEADFFTPEEKAAARRQVIESLQEQNKGLPKSSKDFNKRVIAFLKTGDEDADSDVKDFARESLIDVYVGEVPRGANILPVFVKSENPFDYENPEHLTKIEPTFRANENGSLPRNAIQNGLWSVIESDGVQKAIRESGFDGFYVEEGGIKNLAVYNPEQIKSATGNQGTYDINNPDIRKSLRNTVAVDKNGQPKLLYHSTYSAFDEPKVNYGVDEYRRFGFHVGPLEAAQSRLGVKASEDKMQGEKSGNAGANIIPVYLDIQEPLRLKENRSGRWGVDDVMSAIMKSGKVDPELVDKYEEDALTENDLDPTAPEPGDDDYDPNADESRNWTDQSAFAPGERSRLLTNFIQGKLGYDSIVYENKFEGGGDSYIALSPKQVKSQFRPEGKFSLRSKGEPTTKANVLAAMNLAHEKNPYMNCQLAVQMATGVTKLRELPKVKSAQVGDVYTFNENKTMASHYAIDLGDGNVSEIEEWGDAPREMPLADLVSEYDEPSAIRRPPETAYTSQALGAKASLRSTLPRALMQRIDQTTTARKDEGHVGRMINAISPGKHTTIRAELLNRYDALDRLDKIRIQQMGGAAAMADISSESAALLSDLGAGITASALGVHDKVGGAPVYVQSYYVVRNGTILPRRYKTRAQAQAVAGANGEVRSGGHTAVGNFNNTVKGPLAIFAPLAKINDPDIFRLYQFWAAAKRGKRFDKEGREFLLEPADQQHAADLERRFPAFIDIQKEWTKYNDKLVQYMVDTGVLTPEKGKIYTQYSDYIPFYRQVEGERTAGPNIFAAISSVKAPKEAKGSKAPLDDFLETIVRNTQSAIQAGVKNIAAQRAVEAAKDVGLAVKLPAGNGLPSTVTVLENGVPTHYDCKDALFVNAMKSLGMSEIPFLNIISAPANWLRAAVTKEPTFMLANLLRDSLSSYVTSGVKMTPVVDTMKNFAKTVVGMSPEYDVLRRAGVVGGYDYTQGVEVSGRKFGEQLKKAAGVKSKGLKRVGKAVASPVTGIWNLLEKGSEASDAATRQEIYKKTLAETGNETEALFRSLEVMNFNRKGRNAGVRLFTAMIPFLNARMQGLDILYRTAVRPSLPGQSVSAREKELQHTFMVRGATMAALSCMYWMMTNDDDEYKKQEEDTKDNFWLIPALGVKIPTPFEVGFLFKIIPERIMALAFGDDTFEDFRNSMTNQIVSTLKVNPIPQAVLPALENLVNVSAYTMRPIVSPGLEDLKAGYQVSPNTTTLMADIGKAVGMSPIKLEHAIQGYTGQMGMYLVSLLDAVYDINSTTPRPAKQFEKLPMIKRFAVDPNARGSVTTFYKLKDEVDTAVKTLNMLERTGNLDEYEEFFTENANLFATKEYVQQLANDMKDLAEMKAMIRSSKESAEEKGAALLEIQQMENDITANIKELRQMARSKD